MKKKGFVIIKELLTKEEVNKLRERILQYFKVNSSDRMILPSDIISNFPEVFEIQTKNNLLEGLKDIFGFFSYVNDYQIQKICAH